MKTIITLAGLIFAVLSPSFSQGQKGYHLFNPAPRDKMREFAIDRPDITESAITVDAGHFQFEGDLFKMSKDRRTDDKSTRYFMNGLYKMGITHSWDIHIGLELYNVYPTVDGSNNSGYGSTTIRLKHNFWGNDDDSKTALGMIPYVTFLSGNPFDSDIVYGLGLPFLYKLNDNYDLGAQAQIDFIPSGEGSHDASFLQTIVIGGPVIGDLDFFAEGVVIFSPTVSQYLANGGLIYNASDNVKIDVAGNVGLTDRSPSRFFVGLSFRI